VVDKRRTNGCIDSPLGIRIAGSNHGRSRLLANDKGRQVVRRDCPSGAAGRVGLGDSDRKSRARPKRRAGGLVKRMYKKTKKAAKDTYGVTKLPAEKRASPLCRTLLSKTQQHEETQRVEMWHWAGGPHFQSLSS